jgi:recombination protein RecR
LGKIVKRVAYPTPIQTLIAELKRMPGIGPRSAERIALWMVQSRDARSPDIAKAIEAVAQQIHPCPRCGFFTTDPLCEFCSDPARDATLLCVVEQPTDILPLERTGGFRGLYHSLGGRISPLEHIGPDQLRISELLARVRDDKPTEVILALGADVEGEATASYIAAQLREYKVAISRLAQGLPAGGGLEHADELTISRALAGRQRF